MSETKTPAPAPETKIPVLVVIPPRDGFDGFWCIGRKFPIGRTELEVTRAQLEELKGEQDKKLPIAVVEFSPVEQARRLAASAEEAAAKAEADAQKALEDAEAKAKEAREAKERMEVAAKAAAKSGK